MESLIISDPRERDLTARHRWIVPTIMAALIAVAFAADSSVGPLLAHPPGTAAHAVASNLSRWLDFGPLLLCCVVLLALARASRRADLERLLTGVLLSGLLIGGLGLAVRCTAGRTRPDANAEQGWYGLRHQGTWLVGVTNFNSFPSGHTVLAASLAAVPLVALRRRGWWAMLLPLAAGWSRLCLNRHHLSDVVAALCLGLAGGWVTWHYVLPAWERWRGKAAQRPPVTQPAAPLPTLSRLLDQPDIAR
jgi:membrane-associated phospholipid phosphatase